MNGGVTGPIGDISGMVSPPMPRSAKPIVMIGAGGIVRDAHLPTYRKAGFPVATN